MWLLEFPMTMCCYGWMLLNSVLLPTVSVIVSWASV